MLGGYGFVFVVVIVVSWYPKNFCFVEYVNTFRLLCWWRLGVMILPWCIFSYLFWKTLFPLGREDTYLLLWCWIICTAAVYYVGMIGLLFVLVRFLGCIWAPTCCCDVGDLAELFVPLSWPVSCFFDVLLVLEDKTLFCEDTYLFYVVEGFAQLFVCWHDWRVGSWRQDFVLWGHLPVVGCRVGCGFAQLFASSSYLYELERGRCLWSQPRAPARPVIYSTPQDIRGSV